MQQQLPPICYNSLKPVEIAAVPLPLVGHAMTEEEEKAELSGLALLHLQQMANGVQHLPAVLLLCVKANIIHCIHHAVGVFYVCFGVIDLLCL